MYNELVEYVSVVDRLEDTTLGNMYRALVDVVNDYAERECLSDDLVDDVEILMMYVDRLDALLSKARDLDVEKEKRFIRENVAKFGHFNGVDRISMLVSLLTVSLTRLRDKTNRY